MKYEDRKHKIAIDVYKQEQTDIYDTLSKL